MNALDLTSDYDSMEAIIGKLLNEPDLISKFTIHDKLFSDGKEDIDSKFYKDALAKIVLYYKDDGELDTFVIAKEITSNGKNELSSDDQININNLRLTNFKEKHTQANIKPLVSHYKQKRDIAALEHTIELLKGSMKINAPNIVAKDFSRIFSEIRFESEYEQIANDYTREFEEIGEDYKMLKAKEYETGIEFIDCFLISLLPKRQLLIIAESGTGKTTLCLKIAVHVATVKNKPVVILSLEMPAKEVIKMIIVKQMATNTAFRMNKQELENAFINEPRETARIFRELLTKNNLFIYDKPNATVSDAQAYTEQVKKQTGKTPLVIIDSVTNLKFKGSVENQTIMESKIAAQLTQFKKVSNIPLMTIHHTNADKGSRGSQKIIDETDFVMWMKYGDKEETKVNLTWDKKTRFYDGYKIKKHLLPAENLKEVDGHWIEEKKTKKERSIY